MYRVALFCANVRPSGERFAAFADDIAMMPRHIRPMLRWQLSVADHSEGTRPWTHVWEQEYAGFDGPDGPFSRAYMMHPVHWAHVDTRWFDPESPEQLIDLELVHTFCAIREPVIA
jgi:hypothetical protein